MAIFAICHKMKYTPFKRLTSSIRAFFVDFCCINQFETEAEKQPLRQAHPKPTRLGAGPKTLTV